jgi:tRNA(adenine34) deaminase
MDDAVSYSCPFCRQYPSSEQKDDLFFMSMAYNEAVTAWEEGEVPVGAVVVQHQRIIASAHNRIEALGDATAHAEILAIQQASCYLEDWRLLGSTLYVTKEPCFMCSGALLLSRIEEVVFAFSDGKMGGLGGALSLHQLPQCQHRLHTRLGIMSEACCELLQAFFRRQRGKL